MRIRCTKPEFWRSKTIALLDWDVRFVLKGLESYVDDNGVGKDDIELIAMDVFPRDMFRNPRETLARLSEAIRQVAEAGLIARYTVDDEKLLYIDKWKDIQRIDHPSKGRFPRPDGSMEYREPVNRDSYRSPREDYGSSQKDTALNRGTGEQGNRGTGQSDGAQLALRADLGIVSKEAAAVASLKEAGKKPKEHKMPEDWVPSEETIISLMAKHPEVDLVEEARKCREWFLDKPTIRRAGWERTFVRWVDTGAEKGNATLKSGPPRPGKFGSTNEDKVRGWMEMDVAEG